MICPQCNGKGGGTCHVNTGLDSSQHRWEWVECDMCHGQGSIDADRESAWAKGRAFKSDRVARGERLIDAAERLGISPAQVSKIERGEP